MKKAGNLPVREERSAGGVVFKRMQSVEGKVQKLMWLIGIHSGYHKWVLPKGMIEQGDTSEQTAVREVEEEMGIVARIVSDGPIHEEEYWFVADYSETAGRASGGPERRVMTYQESGGKQTRVHKKVTFFMMEYESGDTVNHSWEMEEVGWFSFEEAVKLLDFPGEREALRLAQGKFI